MDNTKEPNNALLYETHLRTAISYCIENNDVNTATNKIMEFIRDER